MIRSNRSNWFAAVANSVANGGEDWLILDNQTVRQFPWHIGSSDHCCDAVNGIGTRNVN